MYSKNDYIAVFDSGVGGISVLRQLLAQMPDEKYVYFGDSANAPYGSRPTEQVRALAMNAAKNLIESYPVKALVVACNTATAAAIDELRQTYKDLIVVGIEPALKLAADTFPGGQVGVMATEVTLREEKFIQLVNRFETCCNVVKLPAPGLVELVESGKADSPEAEAFLRPLLAPHVGKMDALVLGCTHYPFAVNAIRRIMGSRTTLLDGGEGTARETKRRLSEAGLLHEGEGQVLLTSSRHDPQTLALAARLLSAFDS